MESENEKRQCSIRLNLREAAIIERNTREKNSFSAAGRELLADGLRYRMIEGNVSREFLNHLTSDAIFDEFERFEDAIAAKAGLAGPLGNQHRLEETPDGLVILHDLEILVDGEVFVKGVRYVEAK